jgi:hypothetical protein
VYWNLQQLPTDETVLAWNDQSAGVQDLNTQRWSASNGSTTAMYARILLQATLASEFLRQSADERVAARNLTAAQRADVQTYRAEARFLRALSYWHALDLFGGVPIVTEETPVGAAAPPQATRQQLFDFVRTELEAVRAALPAAAPGGSAANPATYGRATQGAADMLLAKLYLNAAVYTGTARWAEAQAATQRVIASGAYALEPVYQRLFLADNNLSPELIFVVTQDGSRTQTFGGTTYLAHAPSATGSTTARCRTSGQRRLVRAPHPPRVRRPVPARARERRPRPDPVRRRADAHIASLTEFGQGYLVPKYRNVTRTGQGGSDQTFADIDFPVFRLADAYLMFAEAAVRGNGGAADRATALATSTRCARAPGARDHRRPAHRRLPARRAWARAVLGGAPPHGPDPLRTVRGRHQAVAVEGERAERHGHGRDVQPVPAPDGRADHQPGAAAEPGY